MSMKICPRRPSDSRTPRKTKRLRVYTNARDHFWSGTVIQARHLDMSKHHMDQSHLPLPWLSGHFFSSQLSRPTLNKGVFATVVTKDRI